MYSFWRATLANMVEFATEGHEHSIGRGYKDESDASAHSCVAAVLDSRYRTNIVASSVE